MSDSCSQQSDRRQFFTLLQLFFETDASCHIFKNNQRTRLTLSILQRCQSDIENQRTITTRRRVELIDIANLFETATVLTKHLSQSFREVFTEQVLDVFANSGVATKIQYV